MFIFLSKISRNFIALSSGPLVIVTFTFASLLPKPKKPFDGSLIISISTSVFSALSSSSAAAIASSTVDF